MRRTTLCLYSSSFHVLAIGVRGRREPAFEVDGKRGTLQTSSFAQDFRFARFDFAGFKDQAHDDVLHGKRLTAVIMTEPSIGHEGRTQPLVHALDFYKSEKLCV